MIKTIDLRTSTLSRSEMAAVVPRSLTDVTSAIAVATQLIDDVRRRGAEALFEQAERLDKVRPNSIRVAPETIEAAVADLNPEVRAALVEAISRVTAASQGQFPAPTSTELAPGATVTQRWQPVARVGLYVPGGKAVYPSSVVMNVVPAQVAGVTSIALASPAQREFGGSVHPTVLAAAGLLGVDEVYAMGGAGAIGAFAWGVPSLGLEPVDVVTGPGNLYVAAAKRVVRGKVGIDSEAGPTEILVIADAGASPRLVAADLISQAEHDELASVVLVTDSAELAEQVRAEVETLALSTRHASRVREALDGPQSAIVIVSDLSAAAEFSNAYGPEHLELQVADTSALLTLIDNAGAIFMGSYSPVSLGDYLAGSNHVLPTGGQTRFSSGLGTYTFLRPQQIISYDRAALSEVHGKIVALSSAEDLPAHGDAITARFLEQ
jgi:histidinol dehydrogenase